MAWMLCSGCYALDMCYALDFYALDRCVHVPTLAVVIPAPARPLAQSLVPTAGCAFEVRLQGSVILNKGWEALALTGACLKDGVNHLLY